MVEAKNAYLLVDETYRELSYTVPPPPAACLSPRAISVSTMSKAYGVPGIRIGWAAVADRAIIDMIRAVREQVTICNSAIGEYAALRILECKDALLAATRRHVLDNLECLSSWMQERDDLEWIPPAAGVVAFPRLKHGSSADAVCRRLVEGYRTFTVPGTCFDMPRHFRVGYGGTAHELSHGLECLKAALEDTRAVPAGGVRVH
jgi:aspartate/methionine/tyrosine aminotransferase